MATGLNHSPADIMRAGLVSLGVGSTPSGSAWPVYVNGEVVSPDSILVVSDTTGVLDKRNHVTGDKDEHHGVQIKVRAPTPVIGYPKASEIAQVLDRECTYLSVTIGSDNYCIHSVTRTSPIMYLGEEQGMSKRVGYTINVLMSIVDT